ncbi:hypothetical protein WA026_023644 [Henosepilachna vigintioctopunctata]|uniref:Uncharacterized protein n=1 Tax=Henosepilachna vigintioctopunctata TaxID=420089 RepID=A0AAW1USG4_9CUCU
MVHESDRLSNVYSRGEKMLRYLHMESKYGQNDVAEMKRYSNDNRKLANQRNRRIYLIKCRCHNIVPKFLVKNMSNISFDSLNLRRNFKNILTSFYQKTVNISIADTIYEIKNLEKGLKIAGEIIMEFVPTDLWHIYSDKEKIRYEKLFTEIKSRNIEKFNTKFQIQQSNQNSNNTNEWIENLSNTEVPEYANEMLKVGPKFAAALK